MEQKRSIALTATGEGRRVVMPARRFRRGALAVPLAVLALLTGCTYLPAAGPSTHAIEKPVVQPGAQIQVVDVDDAVVRQLLALRTQRGFSESLGSTPVTSAILGPGDVVEVTIWEAPPAALFGTGLLDVRGAAAAAHSTTIPEQMIDSGGFISVPFAGRIPAAGHTLTSVQSEIVRRLAGKANHPEVLVRLAYNSSRNVTVVGEVNHSLRVPLTPGYERLLDALAAAGGVRDPVNKVTIQVTRGGDVEELPLDTIIRDPKQNVPLQAGDVITALFESLSFTALGASGKNQEINFEAQGITLAQALARAGGLVDALSDPRGVFIFRFESKSALSWPHQPVLTTPEGRVPVVYRIDLRDPHSFFVMQSFSVNNKDVLYVASAPVTELQKFLNLVFSVVYPLFNAKTTLGL